MWPHGERRAVREGVVVALDRLGEVGAALARMETGHVAIACGHALSTLFPMPLRAAAYQVAGGRAAHVHILTRDDDLPGRVNESEAHVVIDYGPGSRAPRNRVVAIRQAAMPAPAKAPAGTSRGRRGPSPLRERPR